MHREELSGRQLRITEVLTKRYYRGLKHLDAWVWKVVTLHPEDVSPEYLKLPDEYDGAALRGVQLERLAGLLPGVDDAFIQRAIELDNWCYAIFHQQQLANAGWYAPRVPVSDTVPQFPSRYAYMYRGYTHQDYRGQRLHAFGLVQAVNLLADEGLDGMISLVQIQNHRSRRSIERLGFKSRGTIVARSMNAGGGSWHSWGCKKTGFRVLQLGADGG